MTGSASRVIDAESLRAGIEASGIEVMARGPRATEQHGTTAGYNQHRRRRTVPCKLCVQAENRRKRAYTRARHAAYAELAAAHREEYEGLLAVALERERAR